MWRRYLGEMVVWVAASVAEPQLEVWTLKLLPVLFEDHTVGRFRPLSWSWPVYEIRCGLFNLRERVQTVQREAGGEAAGSAPPYGLVSRPYLQPLQRNEGGLVGVNAVRSALAQVDRVLLLNGRLGPRWDVIAALWTESLQEGLFGWRDAEGWLAFGVDPATGSELLNDWSAWERAAQAGGCWTDAERRSPSWKPTLVQGWTETPLTAAGHYWCTEPAHGCRPQALAAVLASRDFTAPAVLEAIWDLVPATGPAIVADVKNVVAPGKTIVRELYGIQPVAENDKWCAAWRGESVFTAMDPSPSPVDQTTVHILGSDGIWLAAGVCLAPTTVLDITRGPIVLDRGVEVMPHSYLAGPLYVGPGTVIKAGAKIYGETSVGAVCKIAGEVAETTIGDFSNKQHDGFIGHAVLGSWVNLGAGTTCSDLKNNYGPVRIDLGDGPVDTGLRFIGLLMGDHSKTAIGSLLNTGTCIGFSCNVFGTGFPPKYLVSFTWGFGQEVYAWEKAVATAEVVYKRRGCSFTPAHANLFRTLAGGDTHRS